MCFEFEGHLLVPFPQQSNSLSILLFGYVSNLIPLSKNLNSFTTKVRKDI